MNTGNRVAIYARDMLPVSQTFIREQARSLTNWDPILVGRQRSKVGLDLSGLRTEIVPEAGGPVGRMVHYWLQQPELNLARKLKALDVRLVHAHFGTDATDIWPTVKALSLPMLVTLHGYDINIHRRWWETGRGGLRRCAYPRLLLRMAQDPAVRFIAVSEAIKRRAIEYGIPEEKIAVCYIGVDTERFKPGGIPIDQRGKRILFVGRMVENKAPLLMVRAFAEIRQKILDAQLVMIGDGPLLAQAKDLAACLNLDIHFLGAQNPLVVLQQLHESRVVCLPSVTIANGASEAFGIVLIEAQACGVPVVTSAQGGASEGILDRVTGHAFDEGDMPAMVRGLLAYLEKNDSLVAASAAARQHVQASFELRACTTKTEQIYGISASTPSQK